jgi:hypothetical protein
MFYAISINIVVGSNGLLEFIADDHTRSFSSRSTRKEHNATAGIWECRLRRHKCPKLKTQGYVTYFQQADRYAYGDTCATQGTFICCNWPRVSSQSFQDACELEFALLRGH